MFIVVRCKTQTFCDSHTKIDYRANALQCTCDTSHYLKHEIVPLNIPTVNEPLKLLVLRSR